MPSWFFSSNSVEDDWSNYPKCYVNTTNSLLKFDFEENGNLTGNFTKKKCDTWIYDDSIYSSTIVTEVRMALSF